MTPKTNTKPKREEKVVSSPDPLDPAVVLTFADLDTISRSLKKTIATQEQLFAAITALNTISVEGVPVPLEPRLLQRLKSRCLDKGNFPSWLAGIVVRQLHDYAGW